MADESVHDHAYTNISFFYIPEAVELGDDDDSGVYVNVHEMIAMLRCEALVVDEDELPADRLNSIADALAQEAVETMRDVQGGFL